MLDYHSKQNFATLIFYRIFLTKNIFQVPCCTEDDFILFPLTRVVEVCCLTVFDHFVGLALTGLIEEKEVTRPVQ